MSESPQVPVPVDVLAMIEGLQDQIDVLRQEVTRQQARLKTLETQPDKEGR